MYLYELSLVYCCQKTKDMFWVKMVLFIALEWLLERILWYCFVGSFIFFENIVVAHGQNSHNAKGTQ